MTNRWWIRAIGGIAALSLSVVLVLTIADSGILTEAEHGSCLVLPP